MRCTHIIHGFDVSTNTSYRRYCEAEASHVLLKPMYLPQGLCDVHRQIIDHPLDEELTLEEYQLYKIKAAL